MAVIKIEAKKDARSTQTICLIQGDRRTQILRFSVNRYDGGVDLMDLRWVIKTRNAAGVEDIHDPAAVEIGATSITIDWLVDGSVTNDSGMADYELNGLDTAEDGEPIVWKGATGTISMRANIGPKFGETDGMTNIEKLILYVEDELDDVVEAGSAALDAAERANRAAGNVENISEAVESANAAAQRATDAAAAVEDLEGAVNRANTAAATATSGARSAEMAAGAANSAASRATEAAKNVENIEEATVAAYQAAEDAHAAAEVANTAGLPTAMVYGLRVKGETAKASGNPVTFLPDAGSLLQPVTVLEPQQQGSGDPYPAGGGRNLMPNTTPGTVLEQGVTFDMNEDGTVHVTGTNTNSDLFLYGAVLWNTTLKPGTYTFSGIDSSAQDKFFIQLVRISDGEPFVYISAAAPSVSFTLAQETQVKMRCYVYKGASNINSVIKPMLEAGSTASAYQPYSNIRPFIGYDALGLNHTGKNLLSKVDIVGDIFLKSLVRLKAGETYTLSVQKMPDALYFSNEGGSVDFAMNTGSMSLTYTAETTGGYSVLARYGSGASVGYNMQLEHSSAPGAYAPYQGKNHTVQIGQTVCGGRFDWLTGKGLIEWACVSLNGKEAWSSYDGGFVSDVADDGVQNDTSIKSSHYPWGRYDVNYGVTIGGGTFRLFIKHASIATVDEFKAYLAAQSAAGTPVQIAYKLANSVEIGPFTPHIISAADPEQTNTLYGDGRIDAEYVKPLHVSIEERVAAALAAAKE